MQQGLDTYIVPPLPGEFLLKGLRSYQVDDVALLDDDRQPDVNVEDNHNDATRP